MSSEYRVGLRQPISANKGESEAALIAIRSATDEQKQISAKWLKFYSNQCKKRLIKRRFKPASNQPIL